MLFFSGASQSEELISIPEFKETVVDTIGLLAKDDKEILQAKISNLESEKGSQISVLIINTTQPESIEQYSFRVAEKWKVGRKKVNDGVVVVVALQDRKSRIEVGYGLEGVIPDVKAKRILDDIMRPYFQRGDFFGGLNACIDSLIMSINGEELPAPNFENSIDPDAVFGIIMFGIIISNLLKVFFSQLNATIAAAVLAFAVGAIFYIPLIGIIGGVVTFFLSLISQPGSGGFSSSSRSSGWSSSSSSSSSSGGSGGSFGGGGASGSW